MLTKILQFIITFLTTYGLYTMLGTILLFGVWVYFLSLKRRKNNEQKKSVTKKEVNTFLSFLGTIIIISLFITQINPHYIGYGFSIDGYQNVGHNKLVSCSVNENRTNGKLGYHIINYRVQGVDLAKGKVKYTIILDKGFKVLGLSTDVLLAYSKGEKEIRCFDITTGKLTVTINEKLAKQHFPELASGIYEYNFNSKTKLIDIVSKDGLHVSIDPGQNKIVPNASELINKADYEIISKAIYVYTDSVYQNQTKLIGFNDAPIINKLINQKGELLSGGLTFIDGKFLMYDKPSKKVIIMSYETEEKKDLLLSCVTVDGKLIWQVKKDILPVGDLFNSNPAFETCFIENENIIVDFEGFVFSLKSSNGELNWAIRL